ncbi:MAG TPA: phytase [Xanthomonadales bacterium]|nr:phytase [Xanthomonadales bacterium]
MNFKLLLFPALLLLGACDTPVSESALPHEAETAAAEMSAPAAATVQAAVETTATAQDGANDSAIWINGDDPANSYILGAATEGGIEIYTLDGTRVQSLPGPTISLIDVHYNFPLAGETTPLIVVYEMETAELRAFTLNPADRSLHQVSTSAIETGSEVEGLCMYRSPLSDKFYVFAAGEGIFQQWELYDDSGSVAARHIRRIPMGLGAAHCVVHDASSTVFYAQETVGLFGMNAEPESEAVPFPIDLAEPFGHFAGDVKGVAVLEFGDGGGYLLASDADTSRVHAYDLADYSYAATLAVSDGDGSDGVEEAESLEATSLPLSGAFPNGLVVMSDDDNAGENTNFKLVSWQDIAAVSDLKTGSPFDPSAPRAAEAITVFPTVETTPVTGHGDAADDPAIWVHPDDPALSLIIGTQKKLGINVYDLQGNLVQSLTDGRLNNVDLRYGFMLDGQPIDIVTASNRTTDGISIYRMDSLTRNLVDIAEGIIPTGMVDPYGLCMYRSRVSGEYYVIINDTDGTVRQWSLKDNGAGRVTAEEVREFSVGSQAEGCVADDETGALFVAEEDIGIWKYSAEPDGGDNRTPVALVANSKLTDDVEGLSILYGPDGSGYLLASNQGADSYALYTREGDHEFLGLFHVMADEATGIDGASETDGLDVTSANLGDAFPHGVFVVQDGRNITPEDRQNFKLVPWEDIAAAFGLPIHPGYDPRSHGRD